jgi:glycine betaine/proline transport system permease protein
MSVLLDFPAIDEAKLRALRLFIDSEFRTFTRTHGETMEAFFDPLRDFLLASERLLTTSPWPLVVGSIGLLACLASRS